MAVVVSQESSEFKSVTRVKLEPELRATEVRGLFLSKIAWS